MKRILTAALAIAAASPAMAQGYPDLPICAGSPDILDEVSVKGGGNLAFIGLSTKEGAVMAIYINPTTDRFVVIHDWGNTACIVGAGEAGMIVPAPGIAS